MPKIKFGIIGAGWRTGFFLRIAKGFPETFKCAGVVVRNTDKRHAFAKERGVETYASLKEMADAQAMDFVVVSTSENHNAILDVVREGLPCLCETPPARDIETLKRIYENVAELNGQVEIAEQYPLRPHHQAQVAVINSGKIGNVSQAQISVGHGYHGMAMMRFFLGIGFENVLIQGTKFASPIVKGHDRSGTPKSESIVTAEQQLAWLHFENDTLGVMDFTPSQYRAWIRAERVLIRGERGEVSNLDVRYLQSFDTPVEFKIERVTHGQAEDQKFPAFMGYRGDGAWLYRENYQRPILMDDEIAIAHCLEKMKEFVSSGTSFYSLAEASQDTYLGLLIEDAIQQARPVESKTQLWAS